MDSCIRAWGGDSSDKILFHYSLLLPPLQASEDGPSGAVRLPPAGPSRAVQFWVSCESLSERASVLQMGLHICQDAFRVCQVSAGCQQHPTPSRFSPGKTLKCRWQVQLLTATKWQSLTHCLSWVPWSTPASELLRLWHKPALVPIFCQHNNELTVGQANTNWCHALQSSGES